MFGKIVLMQMTRPVGTTDFNGNNVFEQHGTVQTSSYVGALCGDDWVGNWTIDSGIIEGSESNDVIVISITPRLMHFLVMIKLFLS